MKKSVFLLAGLACIGILSTGCMFKRGTSAVKSKPLSSPENGLEETKNVVYNQGETTHHPYSSLTRVSFSESGKDFDPNISTDGKVLYFSSTMHSERPDIYRKDIFSKVVERIVFDDAADINPSISPDDKLLAFSSNRNGKYQIWLQAVSVGASKTPQQLTRGDWEDRNPSWSPDNKKLVFNRRSDNSKSWEIWEYNFETKQELNLPISGLYPKYSPDGQKVICQTHRNRDMPWFSLWSYTFDGEKVEEILENSQWGAVTPCYSQKGDFIVFGAIAKSYNSKVEQRYYQGDDIWVIGSDGNNLIRLTNHDAPDWHPVWGPDNSVYFISKRNGYQNIWMVKPKLPDTSILELTSDKK